MGVLEGAPQKKRPCLEQARSVCGLLCTNIVRCAGLAWGKLGFYGRANNIGSIGWGAFNNAVAIVNNSC